MKITNKSNKTILVSLLGHGKVVVKGYARLLQGESMMTKPDWGDDVDEILIEPYAFSSEGIVKRDRAGERCELCGERFPSHGGDCPELK